VVIFHCGHEIFLPCLVALHLALKHVYFGHWVAQPATLVAPRTVVTYQGMRPGAWLDDLQVAARIELHAFEHPRCEAESVVMDCRMLKQISSRKVRVPHMHALVAAKDELDKSEAVEAYCFFRWCEVFHF